MVVGFDYALFFVWLVEKWRKTPESLDFEILVDRLLIKKMEEKTEFKILSGYFAVIWKIQIFEFNLVKFLSFWN